MTEPPREPRPSAPLRRFLDGYLHQDYRLEHRDAQAAARAFMWEAQPWQRHLVRRALRTFCHWAQTVDDETWRAAWQKRGGAWEPRDLKALLQFAAAAHEIPTPPEREA